MKKKSNYWGGLTYTQKVNYSFLVLVGVPIVFTIIPGFFGYVNIITAYHWWIYAVLVFGGGIVRWIYLATAVRTDEENESVVARFFRTTFLLSVWLVLFGGYIGAYYGGEILTAKLTDCSYQRGYGFNQGSGMLGASHYFVSTNIPGYVKHVPIGSDIEGEVENCAREID